MSRATTERRRSERARLIYELLYQKYVVEQKSQTEIAGELGFLQNAISRNIKRLGIKKK
jgi:DNA-directed RNA polymerase specialized sigma subunit